MPRIKRAFGEDLVPVHYEDLEQADLVVLVGSNTAWCHPVLFQRIVRAKERRAELKLVVIDPRHTPTCETADLHLPVSAPAPTCGCSTACWPTCISMASRTAVLSTRTPAVPRTRWRWRKTPPVTWPQWRTDAALQPAALEEFYRLFARTERVITAFSQGVNQSSAGTDKANSIINCHLLTGRIGRPGMGPFSVTGQPNAMGGREVGGMANMLAAHMELEQPDPSRDRAGLLAESDASRPGPASRQWSCSRRSIAGRVKAVWIIATNPVVSLPNADRVRAALRRCELVVVSDCVAAHRYHALAHVLLPAAAWGEKDGTRHQLGASHLAPTRLSAAAWHREARLVDSVRGSQTHGFRCGV